MKLILSALAFCAVLCAQDPAYSNTFPPYSGAGGSTCTGTSGQILYADGSSSNCTGAATGTGVKAALGVNTGSAGAFVVYGGALGTPSGGVMTNLTGLAIGGTPLTTQGDLLYANATPALARLAIGAANTVLTSNGTTISWAAPIACATCVTSAASLTINNLMTGAGTQASQTVTTGTGVLTALANNAGASGGFAGAGTIGGVSRSMQVATGAGTVGDQLGVTCSGTPVTCTFTDPTASTGAIDIKIKYGAGQGFGELLGVYNASNTFQGRMTVGGTGLAWFATDFSDDTVPGGYTYELQSGSLVMASTFLQGWTGGNTTIAKDTTLCRQGAGTLEIGSSTTCTTSGSLELTNVATVTVATASLKTCTATTGVPWRAAVNDATAPALGVVLTGGGSSFALVHCSLTSGTYLVDGL